MLLNRRQVRMVATEMPFGIEEENVGRASRRWGVRLTLEAWWRRVSGVVPGGGGVVEGGDPRPGEGEGVVGGRVMGIVVAVLPT